MGRIHGRTPVADGRLALSPEQNRIRKAAENLAERLGMGGPAELAGYLPRRHEDRQKGWNPSEGLPEGPVNFQGTVTRSKLNRWRGRRCMVEVLSFGIFRLRRFRPSNPPLLRDDGFVEAPYGGPIEFIPNPSLLRQLDADSLDSGQLARCELLFNGLRDDPNIPRGKAPQLIKLCFRVITEVLLEYHSAQLPGLGTLLKRRRPPELRLDARTGEMRVKAQLHYVFLYPSPTLLARIPAVARPAQVPTGTELREQRREAQLQPSELGTPLPGMLPVVLPEAQEKLAAQLELDDSDLAPPSLPSLPTFVSEDDDLLHTPSVEEEADDPHDLMVALKRREPMTVKHESLASSTPSPATPSEEDDTEDARL